jgi:hypothetical protein
MICSIKYVFFEYGIYYDPTTSGLAITIYKHMNIENNRLTNSNVLVSLFNIIFGSSRSLLGPYIWYCYSHTLLLFGPPGLWLWQGHLWTFINVNTYFHRFFVQKHNDSNTRFFSTA